MIKRKFYIEESYRLKEGWDYKVLDRSDKTVMVTRGECSFCKRLKTVKTPDGELVETVNLPHGVLYANACVSKPYLNTHLP